MSGTRTPVRPARQSETSGDSEAGKRPAFEARMGKIVASAWENISDEGTWYSVSVIRLYKESDESGWKRAVTFGREDLPLVASVVSKVHDWLFQQAQAN